MLAATSTAEYLDFHIAESDVRVRAPKPVLDVLDQMFSHVARAWSGSIAPLEIDVVFSSDVWHIDGSSPSSRKVLAAAHMHARGWRIVGGDYGLVDLATMTAIPFRKLLHVSSSSFSAFPLAYRAAVENSPWYSSAHAIAFYAIDPMMVNGGAAWGERSRINAILKVDGHVAEHPSLEAVEDFRITEHLRLSDIASGIESAMLIPGGFIETADFLERWFSALPTRT